MKRTQNSDITGIIMPNNWDHKGKVIQIAIYTHKEEVYIVDANPLEQELLNHINRRVKVRGKKGDRLNGNRYITVQKYVVLEEIIDDEKGD